MSEYSIAIYAISPLTDIELMAALPCEFEQISAEGPPEAHRSSSGGYSIGVRDQPSGNIRGLVGELAITVKPDKQWVQGPLFAMWADFGPTLMAMLGGHGFLRFPNSTMESRVYWSPEALYVPYLDPNWDEFGEAIEVAWPASLPRIRFDPENIDDHPWFGEGEPPASTRS